MFADLLMSDLRPSLALIRGGGGGGGGVYLESYTREEEEVLGGIHLRLR